MNIADEIKEFIEQRIEKVRQEAKDEQKQSLKGHFDYCVSHAGNDPRLISYGKPVDLNWVIKRLEPSGHGAIDKVEGAVWRVEYKGEVDFLAKYVRSEKVDGSYILKDGVQLEPTWNTWE